jgi:ATP-binding cassette subfamily B protein
MDCGPAALKCLLEGYRIVASYERLREACQTEVDGTSIDTLERLANRLGVTGEQVLLPVDHLELKEAAALPCLSVTRLPRGDLHFVVLWRRVGPLVQVMDPAMGRRYLRWEQLRRDLYPHETLVPAAAWRSWAGSADALTVWAARLRRLGIEPGPRLAAATADPGPAALCHLDAAIRLLTRLVEKGGVPAGATAGALLDRLIAQARAPQGPGAIAQEFYSAEPVAATTDGEPQVRVRGAVLLRVTQGAAPEVPLDADPELGPILRSALTEPRSQPLRQLWALLGAPGKKGAWLLFLLALLAAAGGTLEALLLQSLLELQSRLRLWPQRLLLGSAVALFSLALLVLAVARLAQAQRLGRQLELALRLRLLSQFPRLSDHYFHSRPLSDLAERVHQLHRVRELPPLLAQALGAASQALVTAAALGYLEPQAAPQIALLTLGSLALPPLFLPWLLERDLRVRTHQGALIRFFRDGLLGLTAVRAHVAERALSREQEGLLTDWTQASRALAQSLLTLLSAQSLLGLLLVALLWLGPLQQHHRIGSVLLLVYWSLSLPQLGQTLTLLARQYPTLRTVALRLLEPLSAPAAPSPSPLEEDVQPPSTGSELRFTDVELVLSGRAVLSGLQLQVAAGTHVAVVGRSGAGKSSLLGLLLGFYQPSRGALHIDGQPLDPHTVQRLRRETVWIDPAVQLWDSSLLANLTYGAAAPPDDLEPVLSGARLHPLLSRLPAGLSTRLGEGGSLISGGEGQRVRVGRALLHPEPRLVLLDEPFRGLGRAERRRLLSQARTRWQQATLLCVTHDVRDTQDFSRVLVVEEGQVVEDGHPSELRERPDSRYRALLETAERADAEVWGAAAWRRLELRAGRIHTPAGVAEARSVP